MKEFEVELSLTGYRVVTVYATDAEAAEEMAMNGEGKITEESIEIDTIVGIEEVEE